MANLSEIFGWFSIGRTPTAQQFKDTFSSYFHKSEKLPQTAIYGLTDDLNDKASKDDLANATTKFKGYHTSLAKLQTEYPQVSNKKDFYAWVGTPYPGTVYKVYADGGAWTDTGEVPTQQEIDLAEYVAKAELPDEQITFPFNPQLANIASGESIAEIFGKLQGWYDHWFGTKHIYEVVENGFYICDEAGNYVFSIDATGKIHFANGSISSFTEIAEKGFAIADRQGNTSFKIDSKGNTEFKISRKFAAELKAMLENPDSGLDDINHIITYGQSLGEGSQCSPILTNAEFSPIAKMFNHGIKTRYATDPKYQSFVAHVERQDAENGETPAAGTADMFITEFELDDKEILSSCCARGAMSVAQLSKGTAWYNNMIADVTNGKRIATEQGKSYRLIAVTWTQGEYDYGNGVEYYKGKLRQLRVNFIADIEAITGDDYSELPFVMYQVSSSYTAGKSYPDIGLAQLELALEADSGFYLATPIYHLQYADGWHLRNTSSKWMGAYYGYALSEVMSGRDWKPLHPISHTISSNVLNLKFNKSGLMFEKPQYLTATILNKGFSIKNGSGTEIIQSVELLSDDTIKITCSESPSGLKINYGFSNINNRNAGELRDNSSVVYNINGTDFHLYNWCVIFEYNL